MAKAVAKKKALRIDPPARPMDGGVPFFLVKNKDPEREYVLAYKAGGDYGPEYYEYLGYEIETHREGGPSFAIGKANPENGTVMEQRGHVLMSVAKDRHAQIVEYGTDGVSGQHAADLQADRMLDKGKHLKDAMRGINPRTKNGDLAIRAEADSGSLAAIPTGDEDG